MTVSKLAVQLFTAGAASILLVALSGIMSAQAVHGRKDPAAKSAPAANFSGANAYARQCAACHGAKGEGSKQYPKALTGSRSVGELALFISKTIMNPKLVEAVSTQWVTLGRCKSFHARRSRNSRLPEELHCHSSMAP